MAFYLQIPGIKGSVTDSRHKDWIALHHANFQIKQSVYVKPGQVADRFGSIPDISDLTLLKMADIASPKLFAASLSGKVYDKVVLHVCNSDDKPYLEYTLYKAIVSGYDAEINDAEDASYTALRESFHLNATKVEMRYLPKNGAPISAGYDLETAALV